MTGWNLLRALMILDLGAEDTLITPSGKELPAIPLVAFLAEHHDEEIEPGAYRVTGPDGEERMTWEILEEPMEEPEEWPPEVWASIEALFRGG